MSINHSCGFKNSVVGCVGFWFPLQSAVQAGRRSNLPPNHQTWASDCGGCCLSWWFTLCAAGQTPASLSLGRKYILLQIHWVIVQRGASLHITVHNVEERRFTRTASSISSAKQTSLHCRSDQMRVSARLGPPPLLPSFPVSEKATSQDFSWEVIIE